MNYMNNQSIFLLIFAAFFVGLFIVSVAIDRRRFRNGFYLMLAFMAVCISLMFSSWNTPVAYVFGSLLAAFFVFLVLIVPVLLIINGFIMIKREGFHLSSILSMLFGAMILLGEYATFFSLGAVQLNNSIYLNLSVFFSLSVIYISIIFLAFMFYSLIIMIIPRRTDFDFVIIHGCGLLDGYKVSKLLSDRCDKGIAIYRKSMSACKLIVSGGKGKDEKISEAEAMKQYLLEKGIPENDIILEDQSDTTMSNLVNSRKIIMSYKGRHLTALVTSNYHVFRAILYSSKIYLPCTGIGSHVAFYYWPSAMIREFVALMKLYIKPFSLGMLAIILISILV